MPQRITRRALSALPLAYQLAPSGNLAFAQGSNGGEYTSPTYGWTMSYDSDRWIAEEKPTADGVDEIVLQGTDWAPSAIVMFRTSPFEPGAPSLATPNAIPLGIGREAPGYLENEMLQERREVGLGITEGVTTVGEDEYQRAIYGLFNPNVGDTPADDHWIGSYAIRHEGDSDSDRIIELDCFGVADGQGVLLIHASSLKPEYDSDVFEEVEKIRHSIYGTYESARAMENHLFMLSRRAGGGSRPKVQY